MWEPMNGKRYLYLRSANHEQALRGWQWAHSTPDLQSTCFQMEEADDKSTNTQLHYLVVMRAILKKGEGVQQRNRAGGCYTGDAGRLTGQAAWRGEGVSLADSWRQHVPGREKESTCKALRLKGRDVCEQRDQ